MTILLALALACSGRAGPSPEPPVSEASPFSEGPLVHDAAALVAWFEGPGRDALVQLPVSVSRSPLGVTGGRVGGPEGLALKLRDGTMSVSLYEGLDRLCGDEEPCLVWLEGTWGEVVPMPSFGPPGSEDPVFSVRRLAGRVEGDDERVRVVR